MAEKQILIEDLTGEDRVKYAEKITGPETKRKRFWIKVFAVIGIFFAIFQIYTAGRGPYIALIQRAIHVGFGLILCAMIYRIDKEKIKVQPWRFYLVDLLEIILVIVISVYVCLNLERLIYELGYATPSEIDILFGAIMMVIMIDICRKATGWIFTWTVIGFIAYGLLGAYIPGILSHGGFTPTQLAAILFVNPLGIYGSITGTSATTIAIYFLFGSVMLATGGAKGFLTLALYMAGRITGGGAQVATVSSAMFGMINGSAVANAATIGAFTIPMMKSRGYLPHFAGGVEAAASTGGQITPPVMGAGVFIMAEILGIPYIEIAKMAAVPALLYYFTIMATIYFEAKKRDIKALDKKDMPKISTVWVELVTLLIPVSVLVYLIVMRYTPRYAGFWGLVLSIVIFFIFQVPTGKNYSRDTLTKNMKRAGSKLWDSLVDGAGTVANLAVLIAGSQIIVCIMGITGMGLKLSQLAMGFEVNWLFPYLVLAMVVCLVLGLGLPTVPSYILTVVIAAPIMEGFGLSKVTIHLFIFYYAVLSGISLPVAPVAYVTSVIAQANWIKTCNESIRIGIAGFLVPFVFVYHPGLLGLEGWWMTLKGLLIGAAGLFLMASGLAGYFAGSLSWVQRGLLVMGGIMVLHPQLTMNLIGLTISLVAVILLKGLTKKPLHE